MNDQPNSNEIDAKDPRVARREKMRQIEGLGLDPWGSRFDNRSLISECQTRQPEIQWTREDGEIVALPDLTTEGFDFRQWKSENGPGEQTGPTVRVAGRIMLSRDKGKLIFLTLRDWTGEIQIFVGKNQVGDEGFAVAKLFDLGDLVAAEGRLEKRIQAN